MEEYRYIEQSINFVNFLKENINETNMSVKRLLKKAIEEVFGKIAQLLTKDNRYNIYYFKTDIRIGGGDCYKNFEFGFLLTIFSSTLTQMFADKFHKIVIPSCGFKESEIYLFFTIDSFDSEFREELEDGDEDAILFIPDYVMDSYEDSNDQIKSKIETYDFANVY